MQPAMSLLHEPEQAEPQSEPEQAAPEPELSDHEQPAQQAEPERGLLDFPCEVLARILGFATAAHPGEGLPVDAATLCRCMGVAKWLRLALLSDAAVWEQLAAQEALSPPPTSEPRAVLHELCETMRRFRQYGRALAAVEHFGLSRRASTRQISGFVTYVSGAHSWYKHLPMARDGVFFRFRLDLTARLRHNEEGFSPYVRGDGTEFHYTWATTDDYRQRYGCLEYEYSDDVGDSMDDTADLEEDSATARRLQWPVTREAERDASPEFGTAAGAKALFGLPSWSAQESAGFSLEPVAVPRSGRSASVPVTCLLHSVSHLPPPPPSSPRAPAPSAV